jgi:hypothetical protein
LAGGEALGLYGADALRKFNAVDQHVYEAMSRLSGERVDNLADLSQSVSSWKHSIWSGWDSGAVSKFSGHLGEVYAAEHLAASGASVEWPHASNQAGWDLLIDGHAVNVKTVADVSELSKHFSVHSDVAVVVPGDMRDVPAAAFHLYPGHSVDSALTQYLDSSPGHSVIVDHALSHADVAHQAGMAGDVALAGASVVDVHIPWVSAATAGWREARLLIDARTDVASALTNFGTDVAFRGGGAAIGGKAGALMGGMLGPVGALVGGVLGAVLGGIAASNKAIAIKRRPLDNAFVYLKAAERDYTSAVNEAQNRSDAAYRAARVTEGDALRCMAASAKRTLDEALERLHNGLSRQKLCNREAALAALTRGIKELRDLEASLNPSLTPLERVGHFLWPSSRDIAVDMARRHLVRACNELSEFLRLIEVCTDSRDRTWLYDRLSRAGVAKQYVIAELHFLEQERRAREAQACARITEVCCKLAVARAAATHRLEKLCRGLTQEVHDSLKAVTARYAKAAGLVNVEAAKLGR